MQDIYGNPITITIELPPGSSLTASSGNVANAAATATLTASGTGKTAYITGFTITASGATLGLVVSPTITGLIGGTMTFTYAAVAGALLTSSPLTVTFPKPIPASAASTNIVVSLPALGAGNTNATVVAYGFLY